MSLPRLPPDALTFSAPDAAALHRALAARNDRIAGDMGRVWASWVDGPDAQIVATAGGITAARAYDFGTFLLPPIGSARDEVDVAIYVEAFTTGNVTYSAQPVRPSADWLFPDAALGTAQEIGTPDATGWIYAKVTLSDSPGRLLGLRVTAIASAPTNQKPSAIAITTRSFASTPDGWIAPTSWGAHSLTHAASAGRPDDVGSLAWLAKAQAFVAARYGRTLGCHSLNPATATRGAVAGTTIQSHWYRVRTGPDSKIDRTVRVYAEATLVGSGSASVSVLVDGGTERVSGAVTTAGWYEVAVPAADWSVNGIATVEVRARATSAEASSSAITVSAIACEENDAAPTDYVVTSGGRNEHVPESYWAVAARQIRPGRPIVAGYLQGATQDRWADRFTLFHNAIFNALRRRQTHFADWIRRATDGTPAGTNGTQAAAATPETLWRAKLTPSRDCDRIEVWIRMRRNSDMEGDRLPTAQLLKDGTAAAGAWIQFVARAQQESNSFQGPYRVWQRLGAVAVTPGAATELAVAVGWVDTAGVSAPASSDWAALDGVMARELVPERNASAQYFYADSGTIAQAIPDHDAGGTSYTFTVPSARDFRVRHVRVFVSVNHTNPGNLNFYLQPPGGTSQRYLMGTPTGWASDDLIGDQAPNDVALADILAGGSGAAAGDWILKVSDPFADGASGSLTGVRIELW